MDKLGITVFDVAVIAVAIFGALIGMSSGFAHAILFIASWVGAGWISWRFAKVVQPEIEQLLGGSTELAYFMSLLVVFVGALIVLVMLTNAFSRSVRASPLARPDRILGAGFGAVCAWVAMGTAFLFYSYLGPKTLPPPVEGGATFPLIKEMANFVEPYLPPGFRTRLQRPGTLDPGSIPVPSPADASKILPDAKLPDAKLPEAKAPDAKPPDAKPPDAKPPQ